MQAPYITLLGGDKREIILGEALEAEGFAVGYVGFEKYPEQDRPPLTGLKEALAQSRVLIAPLPGIDGTGTVKAPHTSKKIRFSKETLAWVPAGALLLTGSLPGNLAACLAGRGVLVLETAGRDDVAALNAIPTAEGVLLFALQEQDITLQDSTSLVTGFGRCAKALAFRLQALGSRVTIAARRPSALAEGAMYGYRGLFLEDLKEEAGGFDLLVNTVPALLFTRPVLQALKPGALLIDIASDPGGVDLQAARGLDCKALALPGLPGRVAPVSAGRVLARVYIPLIRRFVRGETIREEANESETKRS